MVKITDMFFRLGKTECFSRTFDCKGLTHTEYIHAIVEEHLDFINEQLTHVRLKQISNLEDFVNGKEVTFISRDFKVSELTPVQNFK